MLHNKELTTDDLPQLLLAAWQEGNADVPYWLLKYYSELGMNEQDVMLIIHVLAFKQKEGKEFPTLEELGARMSIAQEKVIAVLQRLLQGGMLSIDEVADPVSGIHSERYNLKPLMERLAVCRMEELLKEASDQAAAEPARNDIYSIFEQEFGRPLTPMELESISNWLDRDGYSEELILASLKEAVFSGKVHFRYIDRILLEWARNRVKTVDQAKEYAQKFRAGR